jgi:hypothetical protein
MIPIVLRPRKATEIVDAAIEVYRRNPTHFMLVAAAVQVPWLIMQVIFFGNTTPGIDQLGTSLIIALGTLVSQQLMAAVVVQMASDLYLGRETDALTAVQRVGMRLVTAFVAAILQGIVIGFSLLFFLLPAVFVTALLFAVLPVVVLERRGIFSAFERSSQLSRDLKLHIVGAIGIVVAIRVAVGLGAVVLAQVIGQPVLQHVAAALVAVLVNPLAGIVQTMLYYDARIRHEGFDIEMMAGAPAQPQVTPA